MLAVSAGTAILILGMVAHLSFDAATHAAPWTNNDTALYLYIAQQMDTGAKLYVDWQDSNPPSILFIALTAVRIGRHIGVSSILAYDALVLVIALVGLFVLVRSLRGRKRPWPALVLAAAGYLFFLVKPGAVARDFGQREHLFALLLIPELFAMGSPERMRGRPLWCAALAFMAMMKPQFVAILVVLELMAPRRSRLRIADVAGFAAGAVAPLGMLLWHSRESFQALFTSTLSLHLSGAYAFLNRSPAVLLTRGPLLVLSAALAALVGLAWAAHGDSEIRGLAARAAVTVAAAAVAVVHQQKYFPYHFTPLFGLAVVCGAWAAGEGLSARRQAILAGLSAAALVIVGTVVVHLDIAANASPLAVRLGQVIGPNPRALVVSVYSHGLCTPYRGAPRCIGPQSQTPRLPSMALAADSVEQLEHWGAGVAEQVREQRPDMLAISTADAAMPRGLTPATLLLGQFPIASPGEYVRLSSAAEARVQPRGWIILRRRDVVERLSAR
jgi:hypothetical protein